jgi:hypothetical protein
MVRKPSQGILALLATVAVAQGALHAGFLLPTWEQNYSNRHGTQVQDLDPSQMFLSLFGAREFLAGMLWVKADSFFDQGNYDAVLPIIRLCTILDPKQIDIYATGMWHIGYNFTDAEQRSDRRYIPSALALGVEGAQQNPTTYEMFFETGWMWYHKVDDDYPQAVKWFEEAHKRPDIPPARKNVLRNAYERNGELDKSLSLLYKLLDDAKALQEKDDSFQNNQNVDTLEENLDNVLIRMVQRGTIAQKEGRYDQGDYDTKPPFNVGFSVKATVIDPKIIRFEGTWNVLPVGTRIRVILRDADYPNAVPGGMKWEGTSGVSLDPPKGITFMQEQLYVRNQRFNKKVDMSKDPTMYPFAKDKYVLDFYYNPRSAPAHIQDRFGYNGEGMTDPVFLNTEVRPGQRVIFARLELTKDQIWRRGEWRSRAPVVKTANYVDNKTSSGQDNVIVVPSLRGGK